MVLPVTRRLPVSVEGAWDALTDIDVWPDWGPSILAASLDDGGHRLQPRSTGRVQTLLGLWLPFRVTQWEAGQSWAWSVGHVPATAHRVEASNDAAAAVTIAIPLWAAPYAALCWISLGRLGRVVAEAEGGGAG
jgi:hypothetical protein